MESLEPWVAFVDELIWKRPKGSLDLPTYQRVLKTCPFEPPVLLRELSDESLALAIQKEFWWIDAFTELFCHRYEEQLTRWFYKWKVNHEDAQELVQDVYRRFLENRLASFDARQNFSGYLYRTAKNLAMDALRKRKLQTAPLTQTGEPVTQKNSPVDQVLGREFTARLEEASQRLAVVQQEVLRRTMDDVAPQEIASQLGLSLQQVYRHLFGTAATRTRTGLVAANPSLHPTPERRPFD